MYFYSIYFTFFKLIWNICNVLFMLLCSFIMLIK